MDRLAVAAYPDIDSLMSESERWVYLVEEGVDCALRYGALRDSELVARRVAMFERLTVATPAYCRSGCACSWIGPHGSSRSAWLAPDRRHGRSSSTAVEPPPLFSFRKHSG